MDMQSSIERVYSSPELLEAIFLQLAPADIFLSVYLTCRLWKASVDESVQIQRALLFRPMPVGPCKQLSVTTEPRFDFSPHMQQSFQAIGEDGKRRKIFQHPLFNEGFTYQWEGDDIAESFGYPEASWRRLLVCQLPIQEMVHEFEGESEQIPELDQPPETLVVRGSSAQGGVTMGDVHNAMRLAGWKFSDFGSGVDETHDTEWLSWYGPSSGGERGYWGSMSLAEILVMFADDVFDEED